MGHGEAAVLLRRVRPGMPNDTAHNCLAGDYSNRTAYTLPDASANSSSDPSADTTASTDTTTWPCGPIQLRSGRMAVVGTRQERVVLQDPSHLR